MSEIEWRPIPAWDRLYEVSDHGDVRSLERVIRNRTFGGRLLRPHVNGDGYRRVSLCNRGEKLYGLIHRLVMLAFAGPCPEGMEVLHADGDPANNHLSNLSYGTRSDNVQDMLKHGTNVNASKTHCKRGHAFTEANTYRPKPNHRMCRKCKVMYRIQAKASREAAA